MAKTFELVLWDDLDLAEDGTRTRAAETVRLGWGRPGKGWQVRELELTDKHADELGAFLVRYLKAGHVPDKAAGYRGSRAGAQPSPGRVALETWVKGNRIMNPKYPGRFAFENETGSYYVPAWLRKRWEAHLAEQADQDG